MAVLEGLTRASRPVGYRRRMEVLAEAEVEAAAGPVGDIEALVVERGWNDAFPTGLDLAAAAHHEWWLAVLARVDAGLDDDLDAVAPAARRAVVRHAWAAQRRATPGYLVLARAGAADPVQQAVRRRFARLLASFAGSDPGTGPVEYETYAEYVSLAGPCRPAAGARSTPTPAIGRSSTAPGTTSRSPVSRPRHWTRSRLTPG